MLKPRRKFSADIADPLCIDTNGSNDLLEPLFDTHEAPMLKFSKATVALAFSAFATFAFAQTPPSDQALSVADYVKAQESGGLGANKRVAISSFFIQFVRDQGIERSAGSFGMFQAQSATYFTQTRGVDAALLQTVADKLYDGFVADLKAAGIEVVPQSELDANANFQEIRKAGTASPFIDNIEIGVRKDKHMAVNMLVSAKGLPIILNGLIDKKWLPGDGGQSLRGMTLVLGSATAAKTLQAPLLAVRMTVSMIEQKGKGWGSSAQYGNMILKSASWEFETNPLPRFVEDGTAIFVNGVNLSGLPSSRNLFTLTKAVPVRGLELSGVKGEGTNARGSGLLGALGRAAQGADAPADAYIDIQPANFTAQITQGGLQVLGLFVKAMTAPDGK